jgi:hypothetical protein
VLLGIATFLLIRNMNARLRRLPAEFPDQRAGAEAGADTAARPGGEADRAGEPTTPDKAP